MKKRLLIGLLLGASALMNAQVSVGIQIGPPPPLRVERQIVAPGPGFTWIAGYWYVVGGHWRWHPGYWTRPPYAEAHWIPARHEGGRFYEGYWDGPRGHVEHDHRWDHDRHVRDYDRH